MAVATTGQQHINKESKVVGNDPQQTTPIRNKIVETAKEITPQAVAAPVAPATTDSDMDFIFLKESGNRTNAVNASSGACGLGQSLPCSKLANVCPDWQTNRECQIAFFSKYAQARYGGWSGARVFWNSHRWW